MSVESQPGSLTGMSDDRLGTIAVALSVSELHTTPDVVPAVMDRISRDAVAYPEQFDRRQVSPARAPDPPPSERSARRTFGRLAIFGVLLFIIVALVLFAASANAAASGPLGGTPPDVVQPDPGHDRAVSVVSAVDGHAVVHGPFADVLQAGRADGGPAAVAGSPLLLYGTDDAGEPYAVEQGGRISRVVTEAS